MKRNELEKLGLEKEAIDQIMAINGKDIEAFKAEAVAAEAERDGMKSQLEEASKAIDGFKGMDIEGVKKSADGWKAKAEQANADSLAQLSALKFDHALDGALVGAKARNAKAVRALLQSDALKDSNGEFIAERFNEQLAEIKSENDYLFDSDTPQPKIVVGGNNTSVLSDAIVAKAREGAGLRV